MNICVRHLAIVSLAGLLYTGLAQASSEPYAGAVAPQVLASASYPGRSSSPSDTGAIRRANPNSRQGTESISPGVRGVAPTPAQQRPPTLENRGIGNGYPTRQQSPRPTISPQAPGNANGRAR